MNSYVKHGGSTAFKSSSNSAGNLQTVRSGSLFPQMNDENLVRGLLIDAIRKCSKSRDQIAEQMSLLLTTRVTRRALDLYTAESADGNRFPIQYARAFCEVTGDDRLLRELPTLAGLQVIGPDEQALMELGREFLRQKRTAEKMAHLEVRLEGVVL